MGSDITSIMERIEGNIGRCEVLSNILICKTHDKKLDIDKFIRKGYSEDEIKVGNEIIDLYLDLHILIEKSRITL